MHLKLRSTLLTLIALMMSVQLIGCASNDEAEESAGGEETFAEESSADFQEETEVAETDDGSGDGDLAESEDDLAEEVSDEESSDGDTELADSDDIEDDSGDFDEADDDLALDDESDVGAQEEDQAVAQAEETPAQETPVQDSVAPVEEAPTDASLYADGQSADAMEQPVDPSVNAYAPVEGDLAYAGSEPVAAPTWVPVKKIKTEAFSVGGTNLNRVYIARGGDTAASISTKIYGDNSKQSDLKRWNSWLANREPKTGDKIYYRSPSNPQDQMMLTFYEDVGAQPSIYTSQAGDNIRQVSKNLLGENDSWKEVWATNMDVESKGDIPGGLSLRYWPGNVQIPTNLAMNSQDFGAMGQTNSGPGTPNSGMPGGSDSGGGMVDPLNDPLAMNQEPPPLPVDPIQSQQPAFDPLAQEQPAAQDFAQAPPPPESAEPVVPPAPVEQVIPEPVPPPAPAPAPVAQQAAPQLDGEGSNEDADNMMLAGLVGIGLLAVGIIYALAKKRGSRKVDLTQTTQVG